MSRGHARKRAQEFEHTRIVTYTIAAANRDPSKPFPTIEAYWPLPTDEGEVEKRVEDLNEVQAKAIERLRKLYPHKFKAQA